MKSWLLIISLLFIYQDKCDRSIIGKWKEVKVTYKNGETGENVTLDKKPFLPRYHLEFKDSNVGLDRTIVESPRSFKYSLMECKLSIGNRNYLIEKLSDQELILLELDDFIKNDEYAFRRVFIKD